MGLETIVATIYADKVSQLTRLGFKEHEIRTHCPPAWDKTGTPYYSVSREWEPFEMDHADAMKLALKFTDRSYSRKNKHYEGLDSSIEYRNDYSPCYD